jgi:polyisoprenoid-binding protein YceI
MKNFKIIFNVLLVATLLSFTAPHSDVYKVDVSQSKIEWFARKVAGKHNGTIKLSGGDISNTHGNYSGTIEADMNSIEDADLENPAYKSKLENHLKSPDFFDAARYPKSKFVITSVTPLAESKNGSTHSIKGMLTIRDKTNEITFDATMTMDGDKLLSAGTAVIDRSKFDVKYGSKTFFADIGDKMIDDEFTLKFSIVASK